jgi:hypothetical protein
MRMCIGFKWSKADLAKLEEILELDYGVFNIVIFLCNWVKVNYNGRCAIVNGDEYIFIFVNFASLIPILD